MKTKKGLRRKISWFLVQVRLETNHNEKTRSSPQISRITVHVIVWCHSEKISPRTGRPPPLATPLPWAAKTYFLGCFCYILDGKYDSKAVENFFVNKFLWAENVVKGPAQYKFGSAYRYHFSLVTKNIIKAYETVVS